jgi:dihydroorotate dehydrogenase (fumarate)
MRRNDDQPSVSIFGEIRDDRARASDTDVQVGRLGDHIRQDIVLDTQEFKPEVQLSLPFESRLTLRWIAVLREQLTVSLAATSGVHRATDVAKALLVGADITMLASVLLRNGPNHITFLKEMLSNVLQEHDCSSVAHLKGRMSRNNADTAGRERANYMQALTSFMD